MTDKPPLDDPRWTHHGDHAQRERPPAGERAVWPAQFVDQEFRLTDEDGTEHVHIERDVNRRARTERPPT